MFTNVAFVILSLLATQASFAKTPHLTKSTAQSPQVFLLEQTNRAISIAKSIPPRSSNDLTLKPSPTKSAWLDSIYENHVVDASEYSADLSDKLLMTSIFNQALGESLANIYLPKTMGLRQFLERNGLVDSHGKLKADGDQIDSALHAEFPTGFFVRPAVGITPSENEHGMFETQEQLIIELLKGKSTLYDPATYWLPIKSHILNSAASGEAVVLQENLVVSAELKGRLKRRAPTLVRVHTYENKIIPNSLPKRWVQGGADDRLNDQAVKGATDFAQKFLSQLPEELTRKQAWSVEIAAFDNGAFRIANVLTNRGKQVAWSTYLDQPRILKAYTDYFEASGDLQFEGVGGRILRWGFANYFTYWKIRFEKAQGWRKMVAALPPM